MNPIVLYFASGESLYSGAVVLLLIMAMTPWVKNRWLMRVRSLLIWVGLAMMAMACPPFAWWVDVGFMGVFIGWLFVGRKNVNELGRRRRLRVGVTAMLSVLLVALPLLELPWRALPVLSGERADHLVVMGDSLSAGIDNLPPWPELMARGRGIPVRNLSKAGAVTLDALDMARQLTSDDHLVLVEIGGNDLIEGVASAEFERRLDRVLAACVMPGRRVIMFELPLLPHRVAYGRIQRELAAKYQVTLIPKRYLVEVLSVREGTSDGLHLAPAGAQHMAELVASLLENVLPVQTRTAP